MPEPYSLSELKEMFITQKIFREDMGKVYNKIEETNKVTLEHMDEGFKSITDELKPICKIQDDHEHRLKTLEGEPEDALIPRRWRDSVWFKRGMFAGGFLLALLGGYGISLTGVGP